MGTGNALQSGARARWNGVWRRENDGHGRGVPRIAGNVSDDPAGEPGGKRNWSKRCRGIISGGMEKRSGGARQPQRAGKRGFVALGASESIPVAPGNLFGNCSDRDCVPGAAGKWPVAEPGRSLGVERLEKMAMLMAAMTQAAKNPQQIGLVAAGMALVLVVMFGFVAVIMRKVLRDKREAEDDFAEKAPRTENEPAFMAASIQAVIRRLKEQEKELERLHKIEKDRAEQTERLSEEVTRNMPAGLLVVNAQRIISSSNPAAEQALGVKTLGFRRFSEVLGESSGLTKLIADCMATGKIYRREEVVHRTPAGDMRHLGVTISPIRRDTGKPNGAICLLSDLTELAALQQHIQLKDGLAALGELSAGIAHEFKNALATISGYAQLIPGAPGHDAADYAKRILEQSRSITHVVTEFLKYAKPLEIPDECVELSVVVERVVQEVGQARKDVEIGWQGTFGEVDGDEGLLRQALLNLARNAAEACDSSEKPGRVEISGEVVHDRGVELQHIVVRDNGSGITAAALTKLFHPFFTTKASGTGLGLAVVQKIIVQHGGQVEARNRAEGGAEFIITLPSRRKVSEEVESVEASV